MRLTIFFLLFISCYNVYSQLDTVWINYASNYSQSTISVFDYKENLAIINREYDTATDFNQYSLFFSDKKGMLLDSVKPISILNIQKILSLESVKPKGDSIWILVTAILESNDTTLLSVFMLPETFNSVIIDTIQIPSGEETRFDSDFIISNDSFYFENIGSFITYSSNIIIANFYLSVSSDGRFKKFQILENIPISIVLDFERINDFYFLTFFNNTSAILDTNLEVLVQNENLFIYEINDITYIPSYTFYGCTYSDTKVICGGSVGFSSNYAFVAAQISITSDSILIDYVTPLLPTGTQTDIVSAEFELDKEGNQIGVAVGFFNPFNQQADPNEIYITKYNPEDEVLWQLKWASDLELAVSKIYVDNQNDIYLSGFFWQPGFPRPKGFVLKINEDGSLITSQPDLEKDLLFTFYPNPVRDILHFDFPDSNFKQATIFTTTGNLVKTVDLKNNKSQISVSDLPPGVYFVSIDGNVRKFVKQ